MAENLQNRLNDLYAANRRDIYAYLSRMSGDPDLALDLLQDAFVNFFAHYKERPVPDDGSCRRILFRIARNLFLNHVKSAANKNSRLEEGALSDPSGPDKEDFSPAVRRLILALPERERTAIVLRYLDSLKLEEIGLILGLSVSASSRLIQKAEKMLEWEARKAGISLDD
ncbi:MAG: sigma-70 family RNA polymerase sigma factor [Leptospirales bacterium]|nr:sigma-70 family RNA polymerase sigma factor [Leptospirales bacterium]